MNTGASKTSMEEYLQKPYTSAGLAIINLTFATPGIYW